MKLDTYYKAEKIVQELEDVKKIKQKLQSGQRSITLNLASLNPKIKEELTTAFENFEKKLEAELDKLK